MGITSVTHMTTSPLARMAVPVTAKGRKKPPAPYMSAPSTGPMVRPKLKAASHQALTVDFLSGNLAIRIERLDVQVAAAPAPCKQDKFVWEKLVL